MAKRCDHNESYTCQACGECYVCQHEQIVDGAIYWWKCRFQDRLHRTDYKGQVHWKDKEDATSASPGG